MKTAISIPDDVFAEAERLAHTLNESRSQLYSRAVKEFVARHSPNRITSALDEVCDGLGQPDDDFAAAAARHVLRRSDW
jgi:metal-responsive CopG/Arc/MetJ family transcriptional regulator